MNNLINLMNELSVALQTRQEAITETQELAKEVLSTPQLSSIITSTGTTDELWSESVSNTNNIDQSEADSNVEANLRFQTIEHIKDESLYTMDLATALITKLRSNVKELLLAEEEMKLQQREEHKEHLEILKMKYGNIIHSNQEQRFQLQNKLAIVRELENRFK